MNLVLPIRDIKAMQIEHARAMSGLKERWYECEVSEVDQGRAEPDWDRIPEAKRAAVRAKFEAAKFAPPGRWRLWGPQIATYMKLDDVRVDVVAEAT